MKIRSHSIWEAKADPGPLLEELRSQDGCWSLDTSRQDKVRCQRDTQTISIRVADPRRAPGLPSNDVHASRATRVSARFPRALAWAEGLAGRLGGDLGRVMIVRLRPHGRIYRHTDGGDYYRVRNRYHFVLEAPEGCWMECDGDRFSTAAGQVLWFNNKRPYEEGNPTEDWSVRLIVDVLPPATPPIASPHRHFALIRAGIDVAPLLAELDDQPGLWDEDTRRQKNTAVQRETSNIPLRGATAPIPPGIAQRDWHSTSRTPLAELCPRISARVEGLAAELGGSLARATVVRLNPRGQVHPHVDEGEYYRVRDRYHLVLRSPGGSEMISGGETVVFRDGELWWFDNKAPHEAYNRSEDGRIHVIFDVLPPVPPTGSADFDPPAMASVPPAELPADDQGRAAPTEAPGVLADAVRSLASGVAPASRPASAGWLGPGLIHVELRRAGKLAASAWAEGPGHWEALRAALDGARRVAGSKLADEALICFARAPRSLDPADQAVWDRLEANRWRGLLAYEIRHGGPRPGAIRVSPLEVIAQNRTTLGVLKRSLESAGLSLEEARKGPLEILEYRAERFWISLGPGGGPEVPLARGSRLVEMSEISKSALEDLYRLLADYLIRSVQTDGRMIYAYYPSRGAEDRGRDNSVRQWMATRALVRINRHRDDPEVSRALASNIRHNLAAMYREENGLGLIVEGEKVKLGAVALAALALDESPFAAEYSKVRERLADTVLHLWRESGRFRTFYRPADRDDCENFYPGEALLYWAGRIEAGGEPELIGRLYASFQHYRAWHLVHRNPAFIPWHTQAYARLWGITKDPELAEAVFEMNDWLLGVQQWESAPHPDCRGRFYDPNRPFGPPHASSTAVYLEGLADAFGLARQLGQPERADRYRVAILQGLRSLMQLTFKADADMFYVSRRGSAIGGVQTAEYDNEVRVDNVQHALAAIEKINTKFGEVDYAEGTAGIVGGADQGNGANLEQ